MVGNCDGCRRIETIGVSSDDIGWVGAHTTHILVDSIEILGTAHTNAWETTVRNSIFLFFPFSATSDADLTIVLLNRKEDRGLPPEEMEDLALGEPVLLARCEELVARFFPEAFLPEQGKNGGGGKSSRRNREKE